MKRRILSAALATTLLLSLAGCEKKDVSSTSTLLSETPIASTEVSVSTEASTKTSEASTGTEAEAADVEALYEAFMAGEAKAMVTAEGDKGQYYTFTNAMTAGEYYTLDEIIEKLSDNMEQNGWDKCWITYREISTLLNNTLNPISPLSAC